ncbi:hypothetical protein E2562_002563 [Oryza meyeriana var. granulata]|uniref:Uncharacterized protein n=1 Tax=Oryza meyeriana var. granulata TaxID=110450 RepID=A0A6G1F2V9_9ORYZ|nr:hypothetical protein E2562_002563 [Oryza meyeriana var. granulata]
MAVGSNTHGSDIQVEPSRPFPSPVDRSPEIHPPSPHLPLSPATRAAGLLLLGDLLPEPRLTVVTHLHAGSAPLSLLCPDPRPHPSRENHERLATLKP